jgi:hypothetical protein
MTEGAPTLSEEEGSKNISNIFGKDVGKVS